MTFTHLQVKSGYSLLESTITIEKLVDKAAELNFKALALTDVSVLYGTISFYKACINKGIKPIIGMIVHVSLKDEQIERCILLAKNNSGYQNLIKISTIIQQDEQKAINFESISDHTADLVCILPIEGSLFADLIQEKSHDIAYRYMSRWQTLFDQNDFYLGIQDQGLAHDDHLELTIKAFHQKYTPSIVAIQDVRYLEQGDAPAYECLQAINHDVSWDMSSTNSDLPQLHLRSSDEMDLLFNEKFPGALKMTEEIAEKCHVSFDFSERWLPVFPVPDGQQAHDYLKSVCFRQVKQRYKELTKEVSDRLSYELKIIESMQFSDYFLIVADFIEYARKHDILVGPGRGSAAGSIVAYVLGITDVDPIKYDLLFERFLNPERVTMPDIDVDFSDHRRDEVIAYVRDKYGEEHVAQIITFGTFGTRSILRALFKVMQVDERDSEFILKELSTQATLSIASSVRASESLKEYVMQSNKLKSLFKIATKLEGLPRHISTHAAGVVISEAALINHVPLTSTSNGITLTQYPMNDLEALGLLKIDFLGLRNLTFLEQIIASIKRRSKKVITLSDLPVDDDKTFELLQKGKTSGIFQLESAGMKNVLMRLKPTAFEDIVAVNALYRPGPMEMIPTYIKRKHGQEKITFLHPDLAPILTKTYGVLIYQEQIMQIAYHMAGFSLGKADLLRRAVSKKDDNLMAEQKDEFMTGSLQNGYTEEVAGEVFSWIVKFSNYGFNRSHAVAYSKISYQLAYLKTHYPAHFLSILLSGALNQKDKIKQYIDETKEMDINVLPPSINKSFGRYSVEGQSIRMGLSSISGIGQQIVKEIIRARKHGGFANLFEFCLKVSLKIVNRRIIELLILAGAFDDLHRNRASLLASIDQAMDQGELFGDLNSQSGILPDMFGINESYTKIEDFTELQKLADEKELLGVYVSNHPLSEYRTKLSEQGYVTLSHANTLINSGKTKSAVIIQAIKKIRTKRGDPMAFLTLGDETSDMEAVVFPELYRNESKRIEEGQFIFISGKVEQRNNRTQWIINEIHSFDEAALTVKEERIFIKLIEDRYEKALLKIKQVAQVHPGKCVIIVHDQEKGATFKLASAYYLSNDEACIQELKKHFGNANVILTNSET